MQDTFDVQDAQISMLAQFIDVLEVMENMDSIEDIKNDIKHRKAYIKKEIELVEKCKKEKKNECKKAKIIRLNF